MNVVSSQYGDGAFQIRQITAHRNAAQRLALVGARRRQNADGPDLGHRAALDGAQQHFRIGGTAGHKGRDGFRTFGMVLRARVPEQPVGDARPAEKEHLQQPVERNRNLAEEEGAVEVRRHEHVIEHQQ